MLHQTKPASRRVSYDHSGAKAWDRGPLARIPRRQARFPWDAGMPIHWTAGQLKPPEEEFGSACWARTSDPLINSQLLYQLS